MALPAVDVVDDWSFTRLMSVSIDKSLVLHCGPNNPKPQYIICNQPLPTATQLKYLGVLRSQAIPYAEHPKSLPANCRRLSGTIRCAFRSRDLSLLWAAFQVYVKPKVMYAAPSLSLILKCDIAAVESVQRRYTKQLLGLGYLSYEQRLLSRQRWRWRWRTRSKLWT